MCQNSAEKDNILKRNRLGFGHTSTCESLAGLDFHWRIKVAKALVQNLLKDKAMGITLMYSRCAWTVSTANNKLPGKYDEDIGRLSKFNRINFMHIRDYRFQNRLLDCRFTISFGMLTLRAWEAFFIITGKGTRALPPTFSMCPDAVVS